MAKKNGASLMWRVVVAVAICLSFTTIALPFSQGHLPRRVKLMPVSLPVTANASSNFTAPPEVLNDNQLDARLLAEYGAVQVARNGVVLPPREMFASDEEVARWQANVETSGGEYVLQTAAAEALNAARVEARAENLDITPRDADAAARDYTYTAELWRSRVDPGLEYWVKKGRLSVQDAEGIRSLSSRQQVSAILRLEEKGMFFSKDFSKSILCSVAPPGASQHLALLAFDVKEHENPRVREILVRHGWYQTVSKDEPHFTYLGVPRSELPSLGLVRKISGGRIYWVPGPRFISDSVELVAQR